MAIQGKLPGAAPVSGALSAWRQAASAQAPGDAGEGKTAPLQSKERPGNTPQRTNRAARRERRGGPPLKTASTVCQFGPRSKVDSSSISLEGRLPVHYHRCPGDASAVLTGKTGARTGPQMVNDRDDPAAAGAPVAVRS